MRYKSFCSYFTEMTYNDSGKHYGDFSLSNIIVRGEYKHYKFIIVNAGGNFPCAYVDVSSNLNFKNKAYYDISCDIGCHGGLSFSETFAPISREKGWWLGWDYAHFGDYLPDYKCSGHKYTSLEIVKDCISAIDNIEKFSKRKFKI